MRVPQLIGHANSSGHHPHTIKRAVDKVEKRVAEMVTASLHTDEVMELTKLQKDVDDAQAALDKAVREYAQVAMERLNK